MLISVAIPLILESQCGIKRRLMYLIDERTGLMIFQCLWFPLSCPRKRYKTWVGRGGGGGVQLQCSLTNVV